MSEGPKPTPEHPDMPGSPKPKAEAASPKPGAEAAAPEAKAAAAPKPPATPGSPKPPAKAAEPKAPPPPPGPPDQAPPADLAVPVYVTALQSGLAGAVEQVSFWVGDWTVIVAAARFAEACRFLRDTPGCQFDYLSDLTAVDWPARAEKRFDLVASLYSTRLRQRVRVKARLAESETVPSVTGVWPAAN